MPQETTTVKTRIAQGGPRLLQRLRQAVLTARQADTNLVNSELIDMTIQPTDGELKLAMYFRHQH